RGIRRTANAVASEQSCSRPPLGMAGGLVEVSDSVLGSRIIGRSDPLAGRPPQDPIERFGWFGRDQPALLGGGATAVAERTAGRQPYSGSSVGQLGVRIPRHQLFMVDSLAMYPRCRSRRLAGTSGNTG